MADERHDTHDIEIAGNTGPGSATGGGQVRAENVAGRDVNLSLDDMGALYRFVAGELLVIRESLARTETVLRDHSDQLKAWMGNGEPGLGETMRNLDGRLGQVETVVRRLGWRVWLALGGVAVAVLLLIAHVVYSAGVI